MPRFVKPMLARAHPTPPEGDDWAFEFKWDGVRAIVRWDGGRLALYSRLGNDITARYPELHGLGDLLGDRPAMLDGEIVALDRHGRPSFQRIQYRIHANGPRKVAEMAKRAPAVCMVFDVLWLDGERLIDRTYDERREALDGLGLCRGPWQAPERHIGHGEAMLKAAMHTGLEGVVAKRRDSVYEPDRRSGVWRKVRVHKRQEFVIGGWTPGKGRRQGGVGAILVGYYDGGQLRYAGKVGTGFKERDLQQLGALFRARRRRDSPFVNGTGERQARFVEPGLVAEVRFTEWTDDGVLRHGSYQGLRNDKAPQTVVRET
jgi:bifunctional non-homologous end joining protein LigD